MSQIDSHTSNAPQPNSLPTGNIKVSNEELELDCINLISQLEMQISSARTGREHVEKASGNTDKLLSALLDFCERNFDEAAAAVPLQNIKKASFSSLALKEVVASLSWGFAVRNLFGKKLCSDVQVRQTYEELGDSLLCACVSVLRQAVIAVGSESEVGKTIEQSTAVFVEEFKTSW